MRDQVKGRELVDDLNPEFVQQLSEKLGLRPEDLIIMLCLTLADGYMPFKNSCGNKS